MIAALGLALIAPVWRARAWRVPLGYLSYGTVLRSIVGALISTLLSGVLAFGCFGLAPESLVPSITYQPALVGAGTAIALLYIHLRRSPLIRGAALLVKRSQETEIRDACMERLERILEYSARRSAGRSHEHARLTLFVVPVLSSNGSWSVLRAALLAIDLAPLTATERAITLQARASVHIHLGEATEAAEAIELVERPADDPNVELWLQAIEALVVAVGDSPSDALAIIASGGTPTDPSLIASHQIVRAHVFAAEGKPKKARDLLLKVRREAGDLALERALLPAGPCSPIASKILEA